MYKIHVREAENTHATGILFKKKKEGSVSPTVGT
jgi:hypothetical protein